MGRNFRCSIAVIFGFFVFGQFGVFAQSVDTVSCSSVSICQISPPQLILLLDFTQELLNGINTVGTEGAYLGSYVNPDRFVGTSFRPPQQNIVTRTTTALGQKLDYLLATTAIFTSPQQIAGLKDVFAGMLVLFKSRVFFRDLQLVEKLDAEITQKRYELGLGGGWNQTVRMENKQLFQNIIDRYKAKGLFTSDTKISGALTYDSITTVAGRIVSVLKTFLSTNSSQGLGSLFDARGISLYLDPTLVQELETQYLCARTTNICNTAEQTFIEHMKLIGTESNQKIKRSTATFSAAVQRLSTIFSSSASPRQNVLQSSALGTNSTGLDYRFDDGGGLSRWRSAVQDAVGFVKNIFVSHDNTDTFFSFSSNPSSLDNWLFSHMEPLMKAQSRDLSLVHFSETKDFSFYFDHLGKKIFDLKQLLGNKDTPGSLISELGQACELQCGGIPKRCR